jgi:hypothetical protein
MEFGALEGICSKHACQSTLRRSLRYRCLCDIMNITYETFFHAIVYEVDALIEIRTNDNLDVAMRLGPPRNIEIAEVITVDTNQLHYCFSVSALCFSAVGLILTGATNRYENSAHSQCCCSAKPQDSPERAHGEASLRKSPGHMVGSRGIEATLLKPTTFLQEFEAIRAFNRCSAPRQKRTVTRFINFWPAYLLEF